MSRYLPVVGLRLVASILSVPAEARQGFQVPFANALLMCRCYPSHVELRFESRLLIPFRQNGGGKAEALQARLTLVDFRSAT